MLSIPLLPNSRMIVFKFDSNSLLISEDDKSIPLPMAHVDEAISSDGRADGEFEDWNHEGFAQSWLCEFEKAERETA